ncbi:hypothetical protein, partial [Pseudoalteromonas sp. SIMBA_162]|uniref:hypothetical protein n=1 Tax=Pseudoalteromonas sp. SIMBA_162 TaxID=3080867 RepID=UPI003978CDD7
MSLMPSSPQRLCGADHRSSPLHSSSLAVKLAVRPSRCWKQWLAAAALACLPLGAQAADKPLSASAIQDIESEVGARIGVTVLDTA